LNQRALFASTEAVTPHNPRSIPMNTKSPTLSRARTPLIALVFAALIPATTASAATPEELTERCVNRMVQTTQRTVEAIHQTGARGIHKIVALDENDKPVPVMVRAAHKTNVKIEKREIKGDRQINKAADRCIRILNNQEANPALAELIMGARAQAIAAIHTASINTHTAVQDALATALEDEETTDEEAES
jgi:hypothetical protein